MRVPGALLLLVLLHGCDSPTSPPEPWESPDVRDHVTGMAAQALGADGRFRLPDPSPSRTDLEVISPQHALELAGAVLLNIRTAGPIPGLPTIRETIERAHGGSIDWGAVDVKQDRVLSAEGPFEGLPPDAIAQAVNMFGPHYFALVLEGRQPVATIAVAAHTPARVDSQGRTTGSVGNDYYPRGIPIDLGHLGMPITPEYAAWYVASCAGELVVEVPRLIQPGYRVVPQLSMWEVALAEPVLAARVRDGTAVRASRFFVGVHGSPLDSGPGEPRVRAFVATSQQPSTQPVPVHLDGEIVQEDWPLGDPVDFEEVRFSGHCNAP